MTVSPQDWRSWESLAAVVEVTRLPAGPQDAGLYDHLCAIAALIGAALDPNARRVVEPGDVWAAWVGSFGPAVAIFDALLGPGWQWRAGNTGPALVSRWPRQAVLSRGDAMGARALLAATLRAKAVWIAGGACPRHSGKVPEHLPEVHRPCPVMLEPRDVRS